MHLMFKTLMLYPDECEECDLEVFHRHIRAELQEQLMIKIQEKCAIKWHIVMKISLERMIRR